MQPRERLLTAMRGGLPSIAAVAPLYMGLYLAGPRHQARARIWRERAIQHGGSLEVTYELYLDVEHEVYWDGYRLFQDLPDWLEAPIISGPDEIAGAVIEVRPEGCFWRAPAGTEWQVDRPFTNQVSPLWETPDPPRTREQVQRAISVRTSEEIFTSGAYGLLGRLIEEIGTTHALYWATTAPYPTAYNLLGFEGLMIAMHKQPDLVTAIAERSLENTLAHARAVRRIGLDVAFIEEWICSADLISPADYVRFAWPFERDLCRELERLGFAVVFYFCGSIEDRLPKLLELEADALAFEESKKGWQIDIGEVRKAAGEERCLFGNLDVVKVRDLPASALAEEVRRLAQQAGPRAFVTSNGSPFTLDTPPNKLDAFVQAARSFA